MGDFDVDYDLDPELDESDFPFSSTPTPPVEGTGLNAVDWKNSSPDKTTKDSPDSFDEELFAPIQPVPETTVTSKGGTEYVMVDGPQPKKEVLENSTSFAALRDWEKSHETTLAARREAAATSLCPLYCKYFSFEPMIGGKNAKAHLRFSPVRLGSYPEL
eukprot:GHVP01066671.1.p1 GENE.GHVP01066671.1~~GHVP01066671.1.p1  ORF type:complete len:180 (+),score=36.40 GHVP01066671.1:63-542(+)